MNRFNVTSYSISAGGGTDSLDLDGGFGLVRLTTSGSVTLTSSYTVDISGTAATGDFVQILYTGNLTYDGNTVTILGVSVPEALAATTLLITGLYNGSSWEVNIAPTFSGSFITAAFLEADSVDTSEIAADAVTSSEIASGAVDTDELATDAVTTAKITDANVTADKLATDSVTTAKITDDNVTIAKLENTLLDGFFTETVSFESGEQTTYSIPIPFDCTINAIYYTVTKVIAGTDNGTVAIAISGGSTTPSSITLTASTALGTTANTNITSNNAVSAGEYLQLTTSKTTAGGKLLLTIEYTRT